MRPSTPTRCALGCEIHIANGAGVSRETRHPRGSAPVHKPQMMQGGSFRRRSQAGARLAALVGRYAPAERALPLATPYGVRDRELQARNPWFTLGLVSCRKCILSRVATRDGGASAGASLAQSRSRRGPGELESIESQRRSSRLGDPTREPRAIPYAQYLRLGPGQRMPAELARARTGLPRLPSTE